jgi:uncharacterized protein
MFDAQERRILLATGVRSVQHGLLAGKPTPFQADLAADGYPPAVREWRSCFVTLTRNEELRGCCGSLDSKRPLIEDVWHNAYAAGFLDPRFTPMLDSELADLKLSLSVLTPLEKLPVRTREELLATLRPGRDGLVLQWRDTRVTFIPHVWENVPDAHTFVRHLMSKAGWEKEFWAPDMQAWRYEAESISPTD